MEKMKVIACAKYAPELLQPVITSVRARGSQDSSIYFIFYISFKGYTSKWIGSLQLIVGGYGRATCNHFNKIKNKNLSRGPIISYFQL